MTGKNLKYVFCDDWLIFAIDDQKRLYYVNTEMWEEWLDVPEDQQQKANAVQKYMLPLARKRWAGLRWEIAEIEEGVQETFSYWKHYSRIAAARFFYRPRYKLRKALRKLRRDPLRQLIEKHFYKTL